MKRNKNAGLLVEQKGNRRGMYGIKGMWCCELQTRLMIISRKIISADHKHVVNTVL
jgi:hypothetical protein